MTSVDAGGLGADGLAGAITTASGFDDFIRDLPDLVSQEMITAWNTNQTLNGTTDPGSSVVASYKK